MNFEDAYPEDGVENIRWDAATDTYIDGKYGTRWSREEYHDRNRGFQIRPDVVPDDVVEVQDEMF